MEQFMSVNNSIIIDATSKALKIQSEVLKIAKELNLNEMYQIKSRLISTVNNLSANVEDAFSLKNRLDRIRNFVLITGRMLECRDYLQLINKLHINDTVEVINDIDELTNLLMVNSGSIN
jgi:four helix bundle protein